MEEDVAAVEMALEVVETFVAAVGEHSHLLVEEVLPRVVAAVLTEADLAEALIEVPSAVVVIEAAVAIVVPSVVAIVVDEEAAVHLHSPTRELLGV